MNKLFKLKFVLPILVIGFFSGMGFSKLNIRSQKNKHYLNELKEMNYFLLYGPRELWEQRERHIEHIEICMHLDGYSAIEISKINSKAFDLAQEIKKKEGLR